jgi:tRNA G18 (ribose-2'-O)-methylase SpoU
VALPETVSEATDPRLADYSGLTDTALRRRLEPAGGLFLAEGEKVIRRAVAAGYPVRSLLMSHRWLAPLADLVDRLDVPVYLADEPLLKAVTGYAVHRGALASMQRPPACSVGEVLAGANRVAVLEGVVDPTNVGVVFRAAAALGMDGVLLDPTCADPLYRRAVKVSMGSVFSVKSARVDRWPLGLDEVRASGLTMLALTPSPDAVALDDLLPSQVRRCALMLGTEGPGLSPGGLAAADVRVRIPMHHGVDSLNVGAAAAVAFWAVTHPHTPTGRAGRST